jgi:hypothetical protein
MLLVVACAGVDKLSSDGGCVDCITLCNRRLRRHIYISIASHHLATGDLQTSRLISIQKHIEVDGKPISEENFTRFCYEVWDQLEATKTVSF